MGLLAIGYGIPIKDCSVGDRLILTGMDGDLHRRDDAPLWTAVRELKIIARRLGGGLPAPRSEITVRPVLPPGAVRDAAPGDGGMLFGRDEPAPASAASVEPPPPPPCGGGPRDRATAPEPEPAEPGTQSQAQFAVFHDLAERARACAGANQRAVAAGHAVGGIPRTRQPRRRRRPNRPSRRRPRSTMAGPRRSAGEQGDIPPQRRNPRPPRRRNQWYCGAERRSARGDGAEIGRRQRHGLSLYSDGSIEAQMPEGMMRFASIDELRAHLDQRP